MNFLHGMMCHLNGENERAKAHYRYALSGDHLKAARFIDWIERGYSVKHPIAPCDITNIEKLRAYLSRERKRWFFFSNADFPARRAQEIYSEIASSIDKPASQMWFSIDLADDCAEAGVTIPELTHSLRNVGPMHNCLDEHGIPVPGKVRERKSAEPEGWFHVQGITVCNGKASIVGTKSGPLPAMITERDLDVALALAYMSGSKPVRPSFSLETVRNKAGVTSRLDLKQFKPAWLAETEFGQSMYFADWIMKSLTMGDGLGSVTSPFVSAGTIPGKELPAIFKAVYEADGTQVLAGGTRAESNRLELIVRGVDLARGNFVTSQGMPAVDYAIKAILCGVDSSLRTYVNGTERDHRENDSSTRPGARAKIITQQYDEISEQFPVFYRVKVLLGLFATLSQARRDGHTLSRSERDRLSAEIDRYSKQHKQAPKKEFSPKQYHGNGCHCSGGVSGWDDAYISSSSQSSYGWQDRQVNFVVSSNSFTTPVPYGASGPYSPDNGSGMWYKGGSGGHGFDSRVTDVLVMDANNNQGARSYYLNFSGQKVNYLTGRTIDNNHPMAHIYHDKGS